MPRSDEEWGKIADVLLDLAKELGAELKEEHGCFSSRRSPDIDHIIRERLIEILKRENDGE